MGRTKKEELRGKKEENRGKTFGLERDVLLDNSLFLFFLFGDNNFENINQKIQKIALPSKTLNVLLETHENRGIREGKQKRKEKKKRENLQYNPGLVHNKEVV